MGGIGSGGHNKRSAQEHLLRGTFRKSRHGGKVVDLSNPPSPPPAAPDGLSAASRALWDALLDEFTGWAPQELTLLELALRARDLAEDCRAAIKASGLTAKGRPHPLLRAKRAEERFVADVFRQLRLER
jgi:hypothetical protein